MASLEETRIMSSGPGQATAQIQTLPNYLQLLSLSDLNCCCYKLYELATQRWWFFPNLSQALGNIFQNLKIYYNEKWITVCLNSNACFLQYMHLLFFCGFHFLYAININWLKLWFCVCVSLPLSEEKTFSVYFATGLYVELMFITICNHLFFRPG